ncbi:MAG: hypothetical protein JSW61_15360 [Candidatus Thorarchaeota archaeon]|nr:MAG: hypothetical protein JSW61_15360 [Candidatus Thorarchaeota archaeon]
MSKDNVQEDQRATPTIIREELLGRLESEGFGLRRREVSVMTRMSENIVDLLDALVELEIFKSRSEAVAAFVEGFVNQRKPIFDEIRKQATDIKKKREAAQHLAVQALKPTNDE